MLMTKSEYAKHRGVSRQTVYKWIESGELVMNGKKIDVEATEKRQGSTEASQENSSNYEWPERTLEMKWWDFWRSVLDYDGKVTAPVTDADIKKKVEHAAREMNYDVEFLDDGGIYLTDGDGDHYFQNYELDQNAYAAIYLLRHDLCYSAAQNPDDMDYWSPEGMKALALENPKR